MQRGEYLLARLVKEIICFSIKFLVAFFITSIVGAIIYATINTQEISKPLAEIGKVISDMTTAPIVITGMLIYETRRVWKYCQIVILNYNEKPEP